mmetsp:Transcript_17744/g.49936  ORF Transcript_17744/g.49936 Transcript_17744/m.49936 type:complete len:723 (+) Transcript_17744:95-2263(+)|eukprot:CAMPEP_0119131468 /NCGR_PEP_ID=MMETSP1310-20130426/10401_1 /TAXON_ID=464262 /ORGANISM="Genus nov. species nov., Strain RCC2339" /LENGTH=722 /DNA_ID=CAMNT_0007122043 /DNA_START=99 /DNA_END=2267 /DNA_ORIENTATION=-
MGQNPCKHLVEHGDRIGEPELEELLNTYDKDKNGVLDKEETERFLKDLCKALKTPYDKHNAARIIHRCDKNENGSLDITEFKLLFLEALRDAEQSGSSKARTVSTHTLVGANAAPPAAGPSSGAKAAAPKKDVSQPRPQPPKDVVLNPKQQRYNEAFSGPSRIDRDEIHLEKVIGKGQFGEVYIGTCRGMEAAIKVPNLKLGSGKFDMLLNELEIMKKANNPHVCMFMGACHDQQTDKILIVMELMEGDAEKKCKEEGHGLATRLDWVRQSCKGQAWLHDMAQPILHLDLKPSNILFDHYGCFKVCDFGLSAVLPEGEKSLFMRRMRGTPIYMAPEIMCPGQYAISSKSDTYSMAITAWEMCTGKNCFSEYKALAPFKREVHGDMCKRPPMPDDWPESVKELFRDMWNPNPYQRPDLKEVVGRLDGIIEEVAREESYKKLMGVIQNDAAVAWWQQQFQDKMEMGWEQFCGSFYAFLGKPIPEDPTALGEFPEEWQLANATTAELKLHALKGAVQKAVVEAEMERRSMIKSTSSGATSAVMAPSSSDFSEDQKEYLCLKGMLGVSSQNEEGVVDATRFGQVLAYFQPFDKSFGNRLVDLAKQPYFHSFLSRERTEGLLRNSPAGSYLVRFSSNRFGQVVVSALSEGKVKHLVIENDCGKFRYRRRVDKWWDSIPDLVTDHAEQLGLAIPKDGGPFMQLFGIGLNMIGGYGDAPFDSDDDDINP